MRYRTRVDKWIVVLLVNAVALPLVIAVVSYVRMGTGLAVWLPLSIAALMIVVMCILAVPTYYEVTTDRILIRSGLMRWEVPLSEIESVAPTSNPISSPAWSLERLEVKWTGAGSPRSIMISPQRTDEFLRELADRGGTLVVADGRLRRSE